MVDFAACVAAALGDDVAADRVRIAAITFSTRATVEFGFLGELPGGGRERTASSVAAALSGIRFPDEARRQLTDTNIHLALETARVELLGSGDAGFREHQYPLHIVVLTDGKAKSFAEGVNAVDLLTSELSSNGLYTAPTVTRWAFGAGNSRNYAVLR